MRVRIEGDDERLDLLICAEDTGDQVVLRRLQKQFDAETVIETATTNAEPPLEPGLGPKQILFTSSKEASQSREEHEQFLPLKETRNLNSYIPRVETGPVQFGEDWPGLYIRGDDCIAILLSLRAAEPFLSPDTWRSLELIALRDLMRTIDQHVIEK